MAPSSPPPGDPAPAEGSLPSQALAGVGRRPFGIYLHVPFCRTRCGYCDFNTYTAAELGAAPGASQRAFVDAAVAELDLAARVLPDPAPTVSTVFVGGGTPTLLRSGELARLLGQIEVRFGLAEDAEITTEANPESVDVASLQRLVAAGFTRVSFGMQSAAPQVLATLDRAHSPGRAVEAAAEAKAAGFAHVSLDLIYGTPGESLADWQHSLEVALSAEPDHLSAYALMVEPGTRLATRVRRGELVMPDSDDLADKYLLADERLGAAGFTAYEVSNWASTPAARCRHNLGYWSSYDWWGVGPGAHSHVGGVRWWNVRHPRAYAQRLTRARSPAEAREVVSESDRRTERIMLEIRLADGLDISLLSATARARIPDLMQRGLAVLCADRLVLTVTGRLLADAVVRDLTD